MLSVEIELYSDRWFTQKGVRKVDLDNKIKPLLDAVFKHYGFDDSKVFRLDVRKLVGAEKTVMRIAALECN